MAKVMTSGGEALIKALADENVDIIFGYPGGAALHIYDAIYQQDRVQHILVRHEQAATHAADGFARATVNLEFVWLLLDLEQPMRLPVLQLLIWTPFLWLSFLAKYQII